MSPEVLAKKLAKLREFLSDLKDYKGATLKVVEGDHYVIERLLQLLVEVTTDILAHELSKLGVVPSSYRETVRKGVEEGFLSPELGARLEDATGLRNVLVHLYQDLDMELLHENVDPALKDFGEFLTVFQNRLEAQEDGLE